MVPVWSHIPVMPSDSEFQMPAHLASSSVPMEPPRSVSTKLKISWNSCRSWVSLWFHLFQADKPIGPIATELKWFHLKKKCTRAVEGMFPSSCRGPLIPLHFSTGAIFLAASIFVNLHCTSTQIILNISKLQSASLCKKNCKEATSSERFGCFFGSPQVNPRPQLRQRNPAFWLCQIGKQKTIQNSIAIFNRSFRWKQKWSKR